MNTQSSSAAHGGCPTPDCSAKLLIHFDSPEALIEALCVRQFGAFPAYDVSRELEPKIIQLLMTPNDASWQGVLLGLGTDGVTYHCRSGRWEPYIPEIGFRQANSSLSKPAENNQ